jgi:hypothetical protein
MGCTSQSILTLNRLIIKSHITPELLATMPRIDSHQDGLKVSRNISRTASSSDKAPDYAIHTISSQKTPIHDPLILIYNIREKRLYKAHQSSVIKQNTDDDPLLVITMANPPLLCDGRMYSIEVPKWQRVIGFAWRTTKDGKKTTVRYRMVKLPPWVWLERNFKGRWKVMWIERA